jgi:hypothetical protein
VAEERRTPYNAADSTSTRRLLVREAARILADTEDAVRMQVKRGTLPAEQQLGAERDANPENRRIIAALTSHLLELPAASPLRPRDAFGAAGERPPAKYQRH